MEKFEVLNGLDNFCKVLIKKSISDSYEKDRREREPLNRSVFERDNFNMSRPLEEPLVDLFEEEDHIKILVQCRCQEQRVTFHPRKDGITICREECNTEKGGNEVCSDVCSTLNLRTDKLQLENMLFLVAQCNNNNTLVATIPKTKR